MQGRDEGLDIVVREGEKVRVREEGLFGVLMCYTMLTLMLLPA